MRISRRTFLGAGIAAAGVAALPLPACAGRARATSGIFRWARVADGVHASAGVMELGGNVMLVRGRGACLLADASFPSVGRILRRDAEALGGGTPVVVNTHHHADHTGGNLEFSRETRVIAHPAAADRVGAQLTQYRQMARAGISPPEGVSGEALGLLMGEIDRVRGMADELQPGRFRPNEAASPDGEELDIGSVRVRLHHFGPGHTDNDLVVELPGPGVIHVGDLVFAGLHPFFDADGGATAMGWIESLQRLRGLCEDDTRVIPGHGPIGGPELIDAQRDYIERLVEAVGELIDEGVPRAEAVERSWPFMDGLGFDRVRPRAIGAVYDELSGGGG